MGDTAMDQPLVSIILPVYNAQNHLARCIGSILNQTYKNIELIILNDGSKDHSLPVCEEFRAKDSRIVLVDKENSGVSDTRNLGLKLAGGEYVQFVDSDDYIDPDFTQHLVEAAETHHADLPARRGLRQGHLCPAADGQACLLLLQCALEQALPPHPAHRQ